MPGTRIPGIRSRPIILSDMAHGLNIFLGRIRDDGGLVSTGMFLLLTEKLSRMRPGLLFLPTRRLEVKLYHQNLTH